MKKSKLLAAVLAGSMVLSMMAGCSSSKDNNAASNGDSSAPAKTEGTTKIGDHDNNIVIVQGADIKSLDPVVSNEANTHVILRHMYSRLLYMDPQGQAPSRTG